MMDIKEIDISEIFPYAKNPRKNQAVLKVAKSIDEFGWQQPIVVDKAGIIIVGHTRYQAAQELGLKTVPVLYADLPEEKVKAYRIADNRTNQDSEWDMDFLVDEIQDLLKIDFELSSLGFDNKELTNILLGDDEIENPYTKKVDVPIYEPSEDKPDIYDLYDDERHQRLLEAISKADLSDEERQFLIMAAGRHVQFNFQKIAEFYSHSRKEVQELMEDSALVIIDFDKAIANGYLKLQEELSEIYLDEYDEI